MIRLQMYLPNALRRGVFEFLPYPPSFNWFFFGKKFFNRDVGKPILEIDKLCQFYCPTTGASYEVTEPTTVLISTEGEDNKEEVLRDLCEREGFAGYAYQNREVQVSMEPPVPGDVVFWFFPGTLSPVTNWKECHILRYAAREPENSWKDVQDIVDRVGVEDTSRLFMLEKI